MQSCWDARDNNGRIKVLLSEQLIGKSSNPTELEFGAANDIVCFLFQHAPRGMYHNRTALHCADAAQTY
jgi:hypothetical protein